MNRLTKMFLMKLALMVVLGVALQSFAEEAAPAKVEQALTNESVIKLHKLELGDAVIIEKIKASKCNFDVSEDGLIKLKEAGISGPVMQAMIAASKPAAGGGGSPVAAGDPNDPNAPHEAGIWLYSETAGAGTTVLTNESAGKAVMTKIEPSVFLQTKTGVAIFAGFGQEAKSRAVLPGAHARTQVGTGRPVFYFYFEKTQSGLSEAGAEATSPENFALVKMEVREDKKERRVVIGKAGAYSGFRSGLDPKDIRPIQWEKLGVGVYKVTPSEGLANGEYGFMYTGATPLAGFGFVAGGAGKAFCLGVHGSDVSSTPAKKSKR